MMEQTRSIAPMRAPAMVVFLILAFAGLTAVAQAQNYPTRPIRFIVPFPAGSAPDHIARIVSMHMQQTLGQTIVIDNRPGAQSVIGAIEAMNATPDGYTVFAGSNTAMAANPSLFKKLPYDPLTDFTPVARFITSALMLVVKADFPARNLSEFVAYAKARPGQLSAGYASAGMQVGLAELKTRAGITVVEVPYKGVPQAVTDILGGQIAFTFADSAVAITQAQGGRVRTLAVTTKARSTLVPDLPAMSEEIPGFDISVWNGLFARTGTPRAVIEKLHDAANKAITAPEVVAKLNAVGQEPGPMTIDEFRAFQIAEIKKWAAQIKAAGIQPE
jgi:tripartite-type tricarboxylate transporter receptor subunit TctC